VCNLKNVRNHTPEELSNWHTIKSSLAVGINIWHYGITLALSPYNEPTNNATIPHTLVDLQTNILKVTIM